jgi:peptide/nickel transport system substrate-binding protein
LHLNEADFILTFGYRVTFFPFYIRTMGNRSEAPFGRRLKRIHLSDCLIHLFFLVGLIACNPSKPGRDARVAFRYNQHNPITSLDPAFARSQNNLWAVDALFNGLVQMNDQLKVEPCLASRWTVSPDGLTYTFWLRNDVFFHDDPVFKSGSGRRLVADDVVYSFNRLLDDAWPKPGSWIFKGRVDTIQPFRALADSVFVLKLREPFQPMLQILTMQYASIVAPEAAEHYGADFRRHPVGTGPFQFKVWEENQALVLTKNARYFEFDTSGNRLPYLDAVKTTFITDRKTAFLEFKKGNLDYFYGLESSYVSELLTPAGDLKPDLRRTIQFIKNPYLNTEYLGIRADPTSPLRDKLVRQALNLAINRKLMLQTLRNNVGKPANGGFIPVGLTACAEGLGYEYNPEKAALLLKKAGYVGAGGMPKITLQCNQEYLDLCTYIVRQWQNLGLNAGIEVVETATLRERMRRGESPLFRASWIADYPDAESFLTCFYSKQLAPPNYTRFSSRLFDTLYERALGETDDLAREKLYQEMDKILIEEAPVVFGLYF